MKRGAVAMTAAALALAAAACLTPGTSSRYSAAITNATDTAATKPGFGCADLESKTADGATALFVWPLTETSGTTAADLTTSRGDNGTYVLASGATGPTTDTSTPPTKACPRDAGNPWQLDGSTNYAYFPTAQTNPTTFSLEVWFKTTQAGGKIIGFGSAATGSSASYDRHVYIDTSGHLVFGIYNGAIRTITTPSTYTDGKWHQVVATLAPTGTYTGMQLFVDGALVASNSTANYITPQNYTGYWRIGYDNIASWTNQGSVYYFKGDLRYAAVYSAVLTPTQILQHYQAGTGA